MKAIYETLGFESLLEYPDQAITASSVRPGLDVLAAGYIGLAGTVWLAKNRESVLQKTLPQDYVDSGKALWKYISKTPKTAAVGQHGILAMCYVAEGGIFGSLWRFAEALGMGIYTRLREIPVMQQTIEFCEIFDLNPYRLLSGGCALLVSEQSFDTVMYMEQQGIPCKPIGKVTGDNDRVVAHDDTCMYLTKPEADEIYRVI